ncbi:hypothetical protein E2C01_009313 [Portunus trituberculatus]|uniref:Uncharacterized protein n=1 Tax=Portunus trituberculatus TaxID=210409 RepID=A0A5B7D4I2_PORTR|nr:hypothetical protein [Portunus trituberculatus]
MLVLTYVNSSPAKESATYDKRTHSPAKVTTFFVKRTSEFRLQSRSEERVKGGSVSRRET